jgi:hypothetical protein
LHDHNLSELGQDVLTVELEGSMRNRVVESLLQGAYIREYHLWEKECRSYFAAAAQRNGDNDSVKLIDRRPFPEAIKDFLDIFDVTMPPHILAAIDAMRKQVNTMKHAAGVNDDDFITEGAYTEAINAIEGFWLRLTECERLIG